MPPAFPPPPAAAATPAHRPRPSTPTNCKNPELEGLGPPRSPAGLPFPTSITPSPAARSRFLQNPRPRACMHGGLQMVAYCKNMYFITGYPSVPGTDLRDVRRETNLVSRFHSQFTTQ